jgi:DNA-binding transcriptional regulator YdaS (Cro superfamily)
MAVYFARAGDAVKIGTAKNPAKRLATLQCGVAEILHVERLMEGGREVETALHRRYAGQRLRGEWFRWSPDMLTVMVEVAQPEPRQAAVALRRACAIAKEIVSRKTGRVVDGDGQSALGSLIGRRQSTISDWLRLRKINAVAAIEIERALGGRVTAAELRPDLAAMLAHPAITEQQECRA